MDEARGGGGEYGARDGAGRKRPRDDVGRVDGSRETSAEWNDGVDVWVGKVCRGAPGARGETAESEGWERRGRGRGRGRGLGCRPGAGAGGPGGVGVGVGTLCRGGVGDEVGRAREREAEDDAGEHPRHRNRRGVAVRVAATTPRAGRADVPGARGGAGRPRARARRVDGRVLPARHLRHRGGDDGRVHLEARRNARRREECLGRVSRNPRITTRTFFDTHSRKDARARRRGRQGSGRAVRCVTYQKVFGLLFKGEGSVFKRKF